jgi:medium-chain acyl-[acyl-carrier-protein] hydrolase
MKTAGSNPWIVHRTEKPEARLRLFCFPYSGAAANVFRLWGKSLPASVELCPVQLPGRSTRMSEPPLQSAIALAQAAVTGLSPELEEPFAFYGHSLGGLIAFEAARELRRRGGPSPLHLFVSARVAPQLPLTLSPVHDLPQREFVQRIQERYNSIHPQLADDAEVLALVLPTLRADLKVHETYDHRPEAPLACPITAFGAEQDTTVSKAQLEGWRAQTAAEFSLQMFPGGHLFIQTEEAAFLAALSSKLAALVAALPPAAPE